MIFSKAINIVRPFHYNINSINPLCHFIVFRLDYLNTLKKDIKQNHIGIRIVSPISINQIRIEVPITDRGYV